MITNQKGSKPLMPAKAQCQFEIRPSSIPKNNLSSTFFGYDSILYILPHVSYMELRKLVIHDVCTAMITTQPPNIIFLSPDLSLDFLSLVPITLMLFPQQGDGTSQHSQRKTPLF